MTYCFYGSTEDVVSGKVKWVQIDIDAAAKDVDHITGAEEPRWRGNLWRSLNR